MRFMKCASLSSPISIRKRSVAELILECWHRLDAVAPVEPVLAVRIAELLELATLPGAGIRALLPREQVHRTDRARLGHALLESFLALLTVGFDLVQQVGLRFRLPVDLVVPLRQLRLPLRIVLL